MSLLPGFEYDIFISYRHNDNRSGWVTEFVSALQEELAATIKEPLSIYFDKNPHDGLLETHHVDKSLEGKLKCLIFIPIISQTYCDPKSFAWQHEFVAFNKLSKEDQLGRDIKLGNGNVASRILPIKIHDLDAEDKTLLESEMGGALRAIEFIYREPGVNRPLRAFDNKLDNQNKTDYRNQVNKTANAIKEILVIAVNPSSKTSLSSDIKSTPKIEISRQSIVVLPFVNISNDPEQEYFSDGLTEEIITDLSHIHALLVISRSSAMTFKGTSKKISEIGRELNVKYVLEGSIRKAGSQLRITAQLIDADTDAHLWAEKYSGTLEDVFSMQEKVSRAIVNELKIKLSVAENKWLSEHSLNNVAAFDYYIRAKRELLLWNNQAIDRALDLLNGALGMVGPNAVLFAGLAYTYWSYSNLGIDVEANTIKAEEYIKKAFELDPESPDGHLVQGLIYQAFRGQPLLANIHFKKVLTHRPNDLDATLWMFATYFTVGKREKALELMDKMTRIDPLGTTTIIAPGLILMYQGNYSEALPYIQKGVEREPENSIYKLFYSVALACCGKSNDALSFLKSNGPYGSTDFFSITLNIFISSLLQKSNEVRTMVTPELKAWGFRDLQFSHLFAQIFCFSNMKEETFEWLENSVHNGFCNYPLLSSKDPINQLLKDETRFQNLLVRMKKLWEEFE